MRVLTQGQRPRKQYTLSGFKGVDYSSSPLDVAKYRAAKMQNFLLEDGTLHKRKGWEQAAQFDGQINGLWPFDDGDKQCVIVHAGTDIYAWDSASGTKTKLTGDISTIADRRSYAVYKNKKLYILCGDYLAYGHFSDSDDGEYELRTVAGDTDTYVPTTTRVSYGVNGEAGRYSVEGVNCLTTKRINVFEVDLSEMAAQKRLVALKTDAARINTARVDVHVESGGVVYNISNPFPTIPGNPNIYGSDRLGDKGKIDFDNATIYFMSDAFQAAKTVITVKFTCSSIWQSEAPETGTVTPKTEGILTNRTFVVPASGDVPTHHAVCENPFTGYAERLSAFGTEENGVVLCEITEGDNEYKVIEEVTQNSTGFVSVYKLYENGTCIIQNTDGDKIYISDTDDKLYISSTRDDGSRTFADKGAHNSYSCPVLYLASEVTGYLVPNDYPGWIANCTTGCLFGVDGVNDRLFIGGNPDYPNVCFYSRNNDFTYFPDQRRAICGEETSEISGFCRMGDGTLAVLKNTRDNNDVSVYYITGQLYEVMTGEEGNTESDEMFFVKAGSIGESCITAHGTANLSGDPLMVSENGVYGIVLSGNVATDERYARERSRSVNTELLKHDLSDACGIAYKNRYYLAVDGECFVADARYKYTLDADMDDTYNYEWFHYKNIPARVWNVLDGELWFGSDTGGVYRMDSGGWADISRTWAETGTDGTLTVANGVFTYSEDLAAAVESATYVLADGVKANITAGETAQTFTLTAAETDAAILTAAALVFVTETPVSAAWYSGILDLGTPLYRKNLWLLSIGLRPMSGAEVQFGYRIRRGKNLSDAVADIVGGEANAYGAETFDFGDVDFKRFSFEANGFMSQYTKRVFERDFVYMQLYFKSDSASDCVITDITAVFTEVRKNLGVG